MQVALISTILLSHLRPRETSIYLLSTHDGSDIESSDCFYLNSLPYCRRPRHPIDTSPAMTQTTLPDIVSATCERAISASAPSCITGNRVSNTARYLRDGTAPDGYLWCNFTMPMDSESTANIACPSKEQSRKRHSNGRSKCMETSPTTRASVVILVFCVWAGGRSVMGYRVVCTGSTERTATSSR